MLPCTTPMATSPLPSARQLLGMASALCASAWTARSPWPALMATAAPQSSTGGWQPQPPIPLAPACMLRSHAMISTTATAAAQPVHPQAWGAG
jgi:hypothetical protein